ncbi:MAG: RCC1 domain-containing protein [Polyangiaceae bacterium]|jgi:alpha-tubulin suppressor-like RCC1 family protein
MRGRDGCGFVLVSFFLGTACGCGPSDPLGNAPYPLLDGSSQAPTGDAASNADVAPAPPLPGDAGVVPSLSIATGLFFTCVAMTGGTVECWGYNDSGMLGDDTTADSPTPVQVSNLTGALAMATSGYNACALLPSGDVDCWGDNFGGQLGDLTVGALTDVPTQVPGVSDAIQVAMSDSDFDCALLSNRTAVCWGANNVGQLGNGTLGAMPGYSPYYMAPAEPVVGLRNAASLSAGEGQACALLVDGTVLCWGDNASGQLGTGTTSKNSLVPVAVSGLTGVTAVSAGTATCALLGDGTVWCWGDNSYGELGIGAMTPTSSATPLKLPGLSGVTAISVGSRYACAILSDRSVACWGSNEDGTLGNGTTTTAWAPVPVSNLANVSEIAAGSEHTCAQIADGGFACWGNNEYGQLGDGTTTSSLTPVVVTGL